MPKFHSLKVSDIKRETEDAVSVSFEVPRDLEDDYKFKQGQYLTFKMDIGGEELRRSYSICRSPLDNDLRVAIKKVENGRFSSFANDELKVGDVLEVMTPLGRFYTEVDPQNDKRYVAFA
ncbi:MAG: phenylacetic acid degradation protein, partial [Betaproteobacteria bacterium]|nr:phenylacetic acid degradation protein [Betaproteobacteria bacterium]